jgi:hypothetical protein
MLYRRLNWKDTIGDKHISMIQMGLLTIHTLKSIKVNYKISIYTLVAKSVSRYKITYKLTAR